MDLPEPYASAKRLPYSMKGWCFNALPIAYFMERQNIKTVIEVGCWKGLTTLYFASLLTEEGKVYAIDHWLGSQEHVDDPALPNLYDQFLSNVIHQNMTHKIIPIRSDSISAAKTLNLKADLIYIDASHEEKDVYADLHAWLPHLNPEGILCGDDWIWESVRNALKQFAKEKTLQIDNIGNFWCFH